MASRAMYQPLLERLPQDQVTQRMCAAWFALFPLDTLLRLREAPPEVFDMLIGHIVRVHICERRRFVLVAQGVALIMCADAAFTLFYRNWWALPFIALGFGYVIKNVRGLTPERCAPRFIVRITGWHVRSELS